MPPSVGNLEDVALVRTSATWDPVARRLELTLPDGAVVEAEAVAGASAVVEVYGRLVRGRVFEGPWADVLSDLVGRSLAGQRS